MKSVLEWLKSNLWKIIYTLAGILCAAYVLLAYFAWESNIYLAWMNIAMLVLLVGGASAIWTSRRQKSLATLRIRGRKRHGKKANDDKNIVEKAFEYIKEQMSRSFASPYWIFFICFAISALLYLAPIVCNDKSLNIEQENGLVKFFVVAHNTIKLFVVDSDFALITDAQTGIEPLWLSRFHTFLGSVYFVVAPVFTAVTLISFFKDIVSMATIKLHKRRPIYIFSELNDMSISIAADIVSNINDDKKMIVFTDVYKTDDESKRELIVNASRLGAICLSKDIIELKPQWFEKSKEKKFYLISENQDENINQTLEIADAYKRIRAPKEERAEKITGFISTITAYIDSHKIENVYIQNELNDLLLYKEMVYIVGSKRDRKKKKLNRKERQREQQRIYQELVAKFEDIQGKELDALDDELSKIEASSTLSSKEKKEKAQAIEQKKQAIISKYNPNPREEFEKDKARFLKEAKTDEERKKIEDEYASFLKVLDEYYGQYKKKILNKIIKLKDGEHKLNNTAEIYVYATNSESEALIDNIEKKNLHIRRINENRNLVFETMKSHSIFDDVDEMYEINGFKDEYVEEKQMNVAILGLGGYGMELLKTLSWLGQAKGYYLNAFVFDGENGKEKLEAIAPEMLEHNYLGILDESEDKSARGRWKGTEKKVDSRYSIHFYNYIDVNSISFLKKINSINEKYGLTSIYVTLGNDGLNVQTSMNIRRKIRRALVEKQGDAKNEPKIYAVVFNNKKADILKRATDDSKESNAYKITYIGNLQKAFSQTTIEQRSLESTGFEYHSRWADVANPYAVRTERDKYEQTEYFRRSSMAQALFYELTYEKIIYENIAELSRHEHNRWNAFMRADGFVACSCKNYKDTVVKKTHHNLTPFGELSDEDKAKDYSFYIACRRAKIKDDGGLGENQ